MLLRVLSWAPFSFHSIHPSRIITHSLTSPMGHMLMVPKSLFLPPDLHPVLQTSRFKCPLIISNWLSHRHFKLIHMVLTQAAPPSQFPTSAVATLFKQESYLTSALKSYLSPNPVDFKIIFLLTCLSFLLHHPRLPSRAYIMQPFPNQSPWFTLATSKPYSTRQSWQSLVI